MAAACYEKATYQVDVDTNLAFCTVHAIEVSALSFSFPRVRIVPVEGTSTFNIYFEGRLLCLPVAEGKAEHFTLDQVRLIVELFENLS